MQMSNRVMKTALLNVLFTVTGNESHEEAGG